MKAECTHLELLDGYGTAYVGFCAECGAPVERIHSKLSAEKRKVTPIQPPQRHNVTAYNFEQVIDSESGVDRDLGDRLVLPDPPGRKHGTVRAKLTYAGRLKPMADPDDLRNPAVYEVVNVITGVDGKPPVQAPRAPDTGAASVGRSKYGNVPVTTADGRFDSTGEERYWRTVLKVREAAGEIHELKRQVSFELRGKNGGLIGKFRPDYTFTERVENVYDKSDRFHKVAVDFKSGPTRTAAYKLRVKLFSDNYPEWTFREATKDDLPR